MLFAIIIVNRKKESMEKKIESDNNQLIGNLKLGIISTVSVMLVSYIAVYFIFH